MTKMEKKQILLRIPHALWEELNKMADDEYRSLNSQIEYMLVQSVKNKNSKAKIQLEELLSALEENNFEINDTGQKVGQRSQI